MAQGVERFFGDPTPIQRNYLLEEFSGDARQHGISGSVHIQVGAENPLQEALWVQEVGKGPRPAAKPLHYAGRAPDCWPRSGRGCANRHQRFAGSRSL